MGISLLQALGLAVIAKSAEDWRNKSVEPRAKHDVAQFMRSKWFTNLCDLVEDRCCANQKGNNGTMGQKIKLEEAIDE